MNKVVHIADSDALIAMLSKKDANHVKAKAVIKKITLQKEEILFPATVIAETITTMQIRLKNPELAKEVAKKVAASAIPIIPTDADILKIATEIYKPEGSKKNTMFDAIVAATAKKLETKSIFSFDGWYRKLGYNLLIDKV